MSAAHDRPIAHLIAAEYQARYATRIENQDSARRQEYVVYVDEAAHAIRNENLMRGCQGYTLQSRQQRFAPRAAPIGSHPKEAERQQQQYCCPEANPLRFDLNIAHPSAAANAPSVGGRSTRC